MQVTFHGEPVSLMGLAVKVGDRARDVRVQSHDLSLVLPLEKSLGQVRLILTVPSLDTPICACEARQFTSRLMQLDTELGNDVAVFLVSADLPFAQNRWCEAEGVKNVTMLSDHLSLDFARSWGLLLKGLGFLARAVYVVDLDGVVTYKELVPELTAEPNYDAAIEAVRKAVSQIVH